MHGGRIEYLMNVVQKKQEEEKTREIRFCFADVNAFNRLIVYFRLRYLFLSVTSTLLVIR